MKILKNIARITSVGLVICLATNALDAMEDFKKAKKCSLMTAVKNGDSALLAQKLKAKLSVSVARLHKLLFAAMGNDDFDAVDNLLMYADQTRQLGDLLIFVDSSLERTVLHQAAYCGDIDFIKMLCRAALSVDDYEFFRQFLGVKGKRFSYSEIKEFTAFDIAYGLSAIVVISYNEECAKLLWKLDKAETLDEIAVLLDPEEGWVSVN